MSNVNRFFKVDVQNVYYTTRQGLLTFLFEITKRFVATSHSSRERYKSHCLRHRSEAMKTTSISGIFFRAMAWEVKLKRLSRSMVRKRVIGVGYCDRGIETW